jgi:hypothetical protein
LRLTVNRDRADPTRLAQEQISGIRLADTVGVVEHGLKYWLQIAGRTADNLQHLAGRGLLLQGFSEKLSRFGKLSCLPFELLFQVSV